MSLRWRLATTIVAACAAWPALAQQQTPPPVVEFRSRVEIVHLDVSVLDQQRHPVRGLTPQDFTLLADGIPQPIAVFSAVEVSPVAPAAASWTREIAADVQSNVGLQERRLFLIIVDDAATAQTPYTLQAVRRALAGVLDRLGPGDLAALVFTLDNRRSQDFTSDLARLRAAAASYAGGFRGMAPPEIASLEGYYYRTSVDVLESAVEVLANLDDRRKSIIYIGQGVPFDPVSLATPTLVGPPNNSSGNPAAGGITADSSTLAMQGLWIRTKDQLSRVFERASRSNINVYPIDVCGLRVPPAAGFSNSCIPGLEQDYLRVLAANTGGHAVIDTNDFTAGTRQIFDENSAYYLLGFRPADTTANGKLHRLEVRVNRPGVEVRTRSGYLADKPAEAKRSVAAAKDPIGSALAGVLPKSDLPLQVTAVPLVTPNRKEAAVLVVVGVRQPIRENEGRSVERVGMQVRAYTVDGKAVGATRLNANVALRAGASGLAEYEVAARLDLRPGRYQLRIAADVGSLATNGSVYADVDVPDYLSASVAMSSIVLNVTPRHAIAQQDTVKGVLPFLPTSQRAFGRSDRVQLFARLYQGAKSPIPLAIVTRLRDAADAVVFERTEHLGASVFASTRSADVIGDVPIAQLPAGEYLLSVETASGGKTVVRDVRLRIVN